MKGHAGADTPRERHYGAASFFIPLSVKDEPSGLPAVGESSVAASNIMAQSQIMAPVASELSVLVR